jgi:16S rRNA (guanine1207-N2)-methyltransferase
VLSVTALERHHKLARLPVSAGTLTSKPGVRGYPGPPPAGAVFLGRLSGDRGPLVDASGTAGMAALAALEGGLEPADVAVFEPSMAALVCARYTLSDGGVRVEAGLPWDLPAGSVRRLLLAPPADRGNARVLAELHASSRALAPDGVLHVALHKDQGGKRYLKVVERLFRETFVRARERGWRLVEARSPVHADSEATGSATSDGAAAGEAGPGGAAAADVGRSPWLAFEAAGLPLEALAGVHSAGKLDPGTAVLVEEVGWERLAGRRVLDLGCGVGVLGLLAARSGAAVVAVDDDLAAVASTSRNAQRLGLALDVRHSDIDSALTGERFDAVLCNPPFHVGKGVRLDLPEAFIEAARRLLAPGGELTLVANRELPYERVMGAWNTVERTADSAGFKVLRARR